MSCRKYNGFCRLAFRVSTVQSLAKCGALSYSGVVMVKSYEHAAAIQRRRYAAGKDGLAQAVKRYLRRTNQVPDCRLGR